MSESSLETSDRLAASVQKSPNRVTLEYLESRIKSENFKVIETDGERRLTHCILMHRNGYIVTGESVCVDPENFDEGLGRKFAREAAVRELWPLEAFLLRERMANGGL